MTYPIWIGATKDGKMIIGAKNMARYEIDSCEKVFGSQLPHRVVAKMPGGYHIMTPTEARRGGYPITDMGEVSTFNEAL